MNLKPGDVITIGGVGKTKKGKLTTRKNAHIKQVEFVVKNVEISREVVTPMLRKGKHHER